MTTYYKDDQTTVLHGDSLELLKQLPDESVHAVVTDPPYGLSNTTPEQVAQCLKEWATGNTTFVPAKRGGFMGKDWDSFVPPPAVWAECFRVLKPGGHLLAFAGSRTQDLMGMSVRMAGFEIRDSLAWLYGAGFPKSLDVSKAIDKAKPVEDVETVRAFLFAEWKRSGVASRVIDDAFGFRGNMSGPHWFYRTSQNAVPTAEQWPTLLDLLGVAEVPEEVRLACERVLSSKGLPGPAWFAREVTGVHHQGNAIGNYEFKHGVGKGRTANERRDIPATPDAERWQGWGTALKPAFEPVIMARKPFKSTVTANVLEHGTGAINVDGCRIEGEPWKTVAPNKGGRSGGVMGKAVEHPGGEPHPSGRWPANVVLDESQAEALDEQSGVLKSGGGDKRSRKEAGIYGAFSGIYERPVDKPDSGGASRFFKVAKPDKHDPPFMYAAKAPKRERPTVNGVSHSTVKPLSIMRWLVRLVTPPDGTVLDPFAGSGTTLEAATIEGFQSIGIEAHADYLPLIAHRLDRCQPDEGEDEIEQPELDFGDIA